MNAAPNDAPSAQQPTLKQRVRASRRSADHVLQNAAQERGMALPATCAAERMGKLLEQAWVSLDELDEVTTPANELVLEPMARSCWHRIDELEVAVSYARAASIAGMLTQIAVAFHAVDLAATGSTMLLRDAASSRAERCLFSIAAAMCAMARIDRNGGCVDRYMPSVGDKLAFLSPEVAQ